MGNRLFLTKFQALFAAVLISLLCCIFPGCEGGDSQTAASMTNTQAVRPAPVQDARKNIVATPFSMDFYGYIENLKAGDVIEVTDPDGTICGVFLANKDGQYGFLHVYGDDPSTIEDEGAVLGDVLGFRLNGDLLNGPEVFWTGDGERQEACFSI